MIVRLCFALKQGTFALLLGLGCCAASELSAKTITPEKIFGRYQQMTWSDQDGLPQSSVVSLAETPDGYLWFGTLGGLARFDGVNFTNYLSSTTPAIASDLMTGLLADRDGTLWMATREGLVRRTPEGKFVRFTKADGIAEDLAQCLLRDSANTLWIGTDGNGLYRYRDGKFTRFSGTDGLPSEQVFALENDGAGGIWIGTAKGLVDFRAEKFITYTTANGLPQNFIRALRRDAKGNLWIGTDGGGLSCFHEGKFQNFGAREGLNYPCVWTLWADDDGTLWIGTLGGGLYRYHAGRFDSFTARAGLPGDRVVEVRRSSNRDLWIGTDGGLSRLRETRFRALTTQDGLANDFVQCIYQDHAGDLWIGSANGLTRLHDGVAQKFNTADGLASAEIRTLGEDIYGRIWVGTTNGLNCFTNGRFITYTTPHEGQPLDFIASIYCDRAGNLYAGTRGAGVSVLRGNEFREVPLPPHLAHDDVSAILEDRAGSLWFGGHRGGLARLTNGRQQIWTTKDGLATNYIRCLYEDRTGTIWIGTHGGGVSRYKNGKLASVTARDGLFDNIVFQILPDDAGNLWMDCNRGTFRVRARDLEDFMEGRTTSVISHAYGVEDGMPSRECNGAPPAGWRTHDGRLLFPTIRGVAEMAQPNELAAPPQTAIEEVQIDRVAQPLQKKVRLRPNQDKLQIQYTVLRAERPPQAVFEYRLVGLDKTWIDAGTRRTAYYSHLPAGTYEFQVKGDNGDGVWSDESAKIEVIVLPPFWRTRWFFALCALAAGGAIYGVFALRIAQLQKRQRAQENFSRRLIAAHETERRRIAAELHDGLGQTLAVIKNSAAFGAQLTNDLPSAHAQLEQIKEQSAQAIAEVREIAYALRPHLLDQFGLTNAIERLLEKVAQSGAVQVKGKVDNIDGLFSTDAEMSIFRIVQESINNILKHAHATEVEATIKKTESYVHLEIRDNGKGLEPGSKNGERGGFGLVGISERVRLLDGTWTIRSASGAGTTVAIVLPSLGVRREA